MDEANQILKEKKANQNVTPDSSLRNAFIDDTLQDDYWDIFTQNQTETYKVSPAWSKY